MASPTTSTAHILGSACFRSPDESREVALRSDGAILSRLTGRKGWKRAGRWDITQNGILRRLRASGWTEHPVDEEGDVIG